jgi:hypothetical protein
LPFSDEGSAKLWPVCPPHLLEVPLMLQAVVRESRRGHFNSKYASRKYQAGLGRQLLSACVLRRIHVPGEADESAALRVVRHQERMLGFSLVREVSCTDGPPQLELMLLFVEESARRNAVGQSLVRAALGRCVSGQGLFVTCLPASVPMIVLLRRLGGSYLGRVPGASVGQLPVDVFFLGEGRLPQRNPRYWPYNTLAPDSATQGIRRPAVMNL